MVTIRFQRTTLRSRTDGANPLLLPCKAGRPGGGNPTSKCMCMIVPQIVLQQCLCQGIGHHFMALRAGMDAISSKYRGIVVLRIHIIHATQEIQIDHCYIIEFCHFYDGIAQIPQGISVDIGLGLIPILLISHGIIPGSDDRRYKIELGIT